MSRTPTRKNLYCAACKRYTKHERPAGDPVGNLTYRCTTYGCKGEVKVTGLRGKVTG